MLEFNNVSIGYKKNVIISGIELSIGPGIHAIVGPNGAGKTTLMKAIVTLIEPFSGTISYNGVDVKDLDRQFLSIIGYLPQEFEPFSDLSGKEYLKYIAECKGLTKKDSCEQIDSLLKIVGLDEYNKKKAGKYSLGMKRRLGLAQALLGNPEILVLDEPTAGMDPDEVRTIRRMLSTYSKERIVFISTHIMSDIDATANNIIAIKNGKIALNTPPYILCDEIRGMVFSVRSKIEQLPEGLIEISRKTSGDEYQYRYIDPSGKGVLEGSESCDSNINDFYVWFYKE